MMEKVYLAVDAVFEVQLNPIVHVCVVPGKTAVRLPVPLDHGWCGAGEPAVVGPFHHLNADGVSSRLVIQFQFTLESCLILGIQAHIIKGEGVGVLPFRCGKLEVFHVCFTRIVAVGSKRRFPQIQKRFPFFRPGEGKVKNFQLIVKVGQNSSRRRKGKLPAVYAFGRVFRHIDVYPGRIEMRCFQIQGTIAGDDVVHLVVDVRIGFRFGFDGGQIAGADVVPGDDSPAFTHQIGGFDADLGEPFFIGQEVPSAGHMVVLPGSARPTAAFFCRAEGTGRQYFAIVPGIAQLVPVAHPGPNEFFLFRLGLFRLLLFSFFLVCPGLFGLFGILCRGTSPREQQGKG